MKNIDVIRLRTLSVLLILVIQTGCLMPGSNAATPTLAPTATLPPTQTSIPTNSPEPTSTPTSEPSATPTVVPTSEPVNAIAKTSVTIRSRPSKGSDNLGGVYANEVVKVIARNITANWYYILTSAAPDGKAWVLAAGFKLQGDLTRLSIAVYPTGSVTPIILPPIIHEVPGGVALPLKPPAAGALTGLILQKARVRVGPSVGYMEIGALESGTTVALTGRIKGNDWFQIEYPSGLEERGWISSELVQVDGETEALTLFNQLATTIASEADELITAVPTSSTSIPGIDTPVPVTPTADLPLGMTLAQINVRSGPASSFESYGLIEKDQRVGLLGRTLNGLWFQISYPASPTGTAWVAADYIRVLSNISKLPYFNNDGSPYVQP